MNLTECKRSKGLGIFKRNGILTLPCVVTSLKKGKVTKKIFAGCQETRKCLRGVGVFNVFRPLSEQLSNGYWILLKTTKKKETHLRWALIWLTEEVGGYFIKILETSVYVVYSMQKT